MSEGFLWRDAEVTYPDWKGTAQLDEKLTGQTPEQVIGLDPDEWSIVGLDIGGGESGHTLHVVAVNRRDIPSGGDVYPRVAAANEGEIPVTEFEVHGVDPYKYLQAITHSFELRLRLAGTRAFPIRVVGQADVTGQL